MPWAILYTHIIVNYRYRTSYAAILYEGHSRPSYANIHSDSHTRISYPLLTSVVTCVIMEVGNGDMKEANIVCEYPKQISGEMGEWDHRIRITDTKGVLE